MVLVLVGGLAVHDGVLTYVIVAFVRGVPALDTQLSTSVVTVMGWLATGPLRLSAAQLAAVQTQILDILSAPQAAITSGALATAATLGETVTQALLVLIVLIVLIVLLPGGAGIWQFLLGMVPTHVRARVDVAGRRVLAALVSYVRATAVVAVVDAVAIGIGLAVLGVPARRRRPCWCSSALSSRSSARWSGAGWRWSSPWSRTGSSQP